MARYDKYDPHSGGFRAPLAADLTATEDTGNGNPVAVGLNTSGQVVVAQQAASGTVGLLCTTKDLKAGDIVDVMTHGEIVEVAGLTAGQEVTAANASGAIGLTAVGAGFGRVGHTVEATRLIVRMNGAIFA